MKSKRTKLICIAAALAFGVCAIGYAATSYDYNNASYTSTVKAGSVDVEITELELVDSKKVEFESGTSDDKILPGETTSYILRVTGLRADCYVRLSLNEANSLISVDDLNEIGDDWIKQGSYLYYTKSLKKGESTEAFQGFTVPKTIKTESTGTISANISVDAIQSAGMTPDFSNASPWGSVSIQEAKETDNIDYSIASKNSENTLTLTSANSLEASTLDLFSDINYLMPGDTYTKTLEIKNEYSKSLDLSMKTETQKSDLLEAVQLTIKEVDEEEEEEEEEEEKKEEGITTTAIDENEGEEEEDEEDEEDDDNTLYSGSLTTSSLSSDYVDMGKLQAGETKTLQFNISLPSSLDNSFSALADDVIWNFQTATDKSSSIDNTPPVITAPVIQNASEKDMYPYLYDDASNPEKKYLVVEYGMDFGTEKQLEYQTAFDNEEGDLTDRTIVSNSTVPVNSTTGKTSGTGEYQIEYMVTDGFGASDVETVPVYAQGKATVSAPEEVSTNALYMATGTIIWGEEVSSVKFWLDDDKTNMITVTDPIDKESNGDGTYTYHYTATFSTKGMSEGDTPVVHMKVTPKDTPIPIEIKTSSTVVSKNITDLGGPRFLDSEDSNYGYVTLDKDYSTIGSDSVWTLSEYQEILKDAQEDRDEKYKK